MRTAMLTSVLLAVTGAPLVAQGPSAMARMMNAAGEPLGVVELRETPRQGVLLQLDLEGLTPGVHAFHIHEVGSCTPDFGAAGGHFSPRDRAHGLLHPDGPHAGDLLNVTVLPSGAVEAERLAGAVTLAPDQAGSLFDEDGSALVIHSGADDYLSQPSGAAGDPVACGVIRR